MKPVNDVVNRIKREIASGDTTSLETMLQNLPVEFLNAYLGEDEGYQLVGTDMKPIREGDEVLVLDEDRFGIVLEISSDADDEYYARVQIGERVRCVYDDNIVLA